MITQSADGRWVYSCEYPGCPFQTSNWPDEEVADERGLQHENEHKTGNLMEPLEDFESRVYGRRVE